MVWTKSFDDHYFVHSIAKMTKKNDLYPGPLEAVLQSETEPKDHFLDPNVIEFYPYLPRRPYHKLSRALQLKFIQMYRCGGLLHTIISYERTAPVDTQPATLSQPSLRLSEQP